MQHLTIQTSARKRWAVKDQRRHLFFTFRLLPALLFAFQLSASTAFAVELLVYPPVPGLAPSAHYQVRIRSVNDGAEWQKAFAFETECKAIEEDTDAYFDHLAGWSHAYVNFETSGAVEVEISRVNGQPIRSAQCILSAKRPHVRSKTAKRLSGSTNLLSSPLTSTARWTARTPAKATKALRSTPSPCLPIRRSRISPAGDPGVFAVKPGVVPPSDGDWTTLYFLPGIHDVGVAFPLRGDRRYYIPGDAIVYGTLSSTTWARAKTFASLDTAPSRERS